MTRLVLLTVAALMLSGCFNWQSAYDGAARHECSTIVNADERQACNSSVERNASEQRAEDRRS